ncbi:hypothetical protein MTO96_008043 [Rhipicephalus appendiculatus]
MDPEAELASHVDEKEISSLVHSRPYYGFFSSDICFQMALPRDITRQRVLLPQMHRESGSLSTPSSHASLGVAVSSRAEGKVMRRCGTGGTRLTDQRREREAKPSL